MCDARDTFVKGIQTGRLDWVRAICSTGLGYGAESFSVHKSWSQLGHGRPWSCSGVNVLSV